MTMLSGPLRPTQDTPWADGLRVLVITPSPTDEQTLRQLLEGEGFEVFSCERFSEGLHHARSTEVEVVIVDDSVVRGESGAVLRLLKRQLPWAHWVIISNGPSEIAPAEGDTFFLAGEPPEALVDAIRSELAGQVSGERRIRFDSRTFPALKLPPRNDS